jgi:hypothetical protein
LVMMRDPWGLAIQLCKRGVPMLKWNGWNKKAALNAA